jgi:hypothetical protein
MVKDMFTSLPVPFFREFIFKNKFNEKSGETFSNLK